MRRLVVNWLWLFVFGAFVIGFSIGGWSASKEAPAQQHTEWTDSAKDRADAKPSPVSQSHTDHETTKPPEKEERSVWSWTGSFFELKLTDVMIAFFTYVLAVKTAGLFKETAGLRSAADKQSRDMEASIKAAQKAADAAQKAADVSEAALIVAERPYLIPLEPKLKIYRYGPPGNPPSEPPEWVGVLEYGSKNDGRSVAFLKEVTAELLFSESLPERPNFTVGGVRIILGHYPIAVDRPYVCPVYGTRDKIDGSTFARIRDDRLNRFFFGYVRYTDIFGYLHTEGFCFRFTKVGDGANIQSECTIVGGNTYNFTRREKLPVVGYESPTFKGGEASDCDIARINKIANNK
jgi:hypothetical protein